MRRLNILILTLLVSASVFAQRLDREKIKALKIAHITEQMDLTQEEAQKFWPIYNANETAEHKLRESSTNRRKEIRPKDLTEKEAKDFLLEMQDIHEQSEKLKSKMLKDLLEILPAKKIIAFYRAEKSFKRKMLQEFKSRHSGRDRKN